MTVVCGFTPPFSLSGEPGLRNAANGASGDADDRPAEAFVTEASLDVVLRLAGAEDRRVHDSDSRALL